MRLSGKVPGLKEGNSGIVEPQNGRIVSVVIGDLGSVTKELDRWIEKLRITNNVGVMQNTALLGTVRILGKAFEI